MRGRRRRAAAALLAITQTAGGFLAPRPKCSTATALRAATQEPAAASAEPLQRRPNDDELRLRQPRRGLRPGGLWGRDPEFSLVPTHVVMPRGAVPVVQRFLAYHKHVLPVRGFKTIDGSDIEALGVVDASAAFSWEDPKDGSVSAQSLHVYDHHVGGEGEESESSGLHATEVVVEPVGYDDTWSRKDCVDADVTPSVPEATLYVLGISERTRAASPTRDDDGARRGRSSLAPEKRRVAGGHRRVRGGTHKWRSAEDIGDGAADGRVALVSRGWCGDGRRCGPRATCRASRRSWKSCWS